MKYRLRCIHKQTLYRSPLWISKIENKTHKSDNKHALIFNLKYARINKSLLSNGHFDFASNFFEIKIEKK